MKKYLCAAMSLALMTTMAFGANTGYNPSSSTQNQPQSGQITSDTVMSHDSVGDGVGDGVADQYAGMKADPTAPDQKSSASIPVKVTFNGSAPEHVIAAGFNQTELTFSYSYGAPIWDPVNLDYVYTSSGTTPGWSASSKDVTVTNYSDIAVNIAAKYMPADGITGLSAAIKADNVDGSTITLTDAIDKNPKKGTFTLTMSGTPTPEQSLNQTVQVGSLTLTVSKAAQG